MIGIDVMCFIVAMRPFSPPSLFPPSPSPAVYRLPSKATTESHQFDGPLSGRNLTHIKAFLNATKDLYCILPVK